MNLDWLLSRRIPSIRFITALEKAFGQAWFDGALSFVDGRFKGEAESQPLPFWILQFWHNLHDIISVKRQWEQAAEWLNRAERMGGDQNATLRQDACHVQDSFSWLEWNGPVRALGANIVTSELA
ncbi:hypothetical protein K439DRAFT_1619013 [Ramaria rubella]|nr:hypothetical protein K439DRAFT_1619013 [Ramaria rubella]